MPDMMPFIDLAAQQARIASGVEAALTALGASSLMDSGWYSSSFMDESYSDEQPQQPRTSRSPAVIARHQTRAFRVFALRRRPVVADGL